MLIQKLFNKILSSYLNESVNSNNEVYNKLVSLQNDFAGAAQEVYDNWEQDSEGYDEHYGAGGICDDIAEAICNIVQEKTPYSCFQLYDEYAFHTSSYAYDVDSKTIYNIDIPPYNYEKGSGYTWEKIDGVKFDSDYLIIKEEDWDTYLDDEGNLLDIW